MRDDLPEWPDLAFILPMLAVLALAVVCAAVICAPIGLVWWATLALRGRC